MSNVINIPTNLPCSDQEFNSIEEMEVFDRLPKEVRRILADMPCDLSAPDTLAVLRTGVSPGAIAQSAAELGAAFVSEGYRERGVEL